MLLTSAIEPDMLDREVILDRVGGDESLLEEITEIFLSEYPSLIAQIREAIRAGDPDGLQHSAHTLKGSVSNFGAPQATRAALELEMMGRKHRLDEAPEALRALEMHFAALEPALRSMAPGRRQPGRRQ